MNSTRPSNRYSVIFESKIVVVVSTTQSGIAFLVCLWNKPTKKSKLKVEINYI